MAFACPSSLIGQRGPGDRRCHGAIWLAVGPKVDRMKQRLLAAGKSSARAQAHRSRSATRLAGTISIAVAIASTAGCGARPEGHSEPTSLDTSKAVRPERSIAALSLGTDHACVLTTSGGVKCWGGNDYGQLGYGDTQARGDDPWEMGDNLPFVDSGFGVAEGIVAGDGYTCVHGGNSVKCWGRNDYGQLGYQDTRNRGDNPGEMGGSLSSINLVLTVTAISAQGGHTCAWNSSGGVKCWGRNNIGQLGLGDTNHRGDTVGDMGSALPFVELPQVHPVKQLSAGWMHSCAIIEPPGLTKRAKCWGNGGSGRLGIGNSSARGDAPNEMGTNLPVLSLGTNRVPVTISAGGAHSCALLDDNTIKCWGNNAFGQLGLGDTASRGGSPNQMGDMLPALSLGSNFNNAKMVVAGTSNSSCAISTDQYELKCWGNGASGQLGLGDTANRGVAANQMGNQLPKVDVASGSGFYPDIVDMGDQFACVMSQHRQIKCWGLNNRGQLGLGDTNNRGDGPNEMGYLLPEVNLGSLSQGNCTAPTTSPLIDAAQDKTVATDIAALSFLLYRGTNPVQQGVSASSQYRVGNALYSGVLDGQRVAILKGRVVDTNGLPVRCAEIGVVGKPEFGVSATYADGSFEMAVIGGGELALRISRPGYLPAFRNLHPAWRSYATVPDVKLATRAAAIPTTVTSGGGTATTLQAPTTTDENGSRSPTIVVPSATFAKRSDDTTIQTYRVSVTEYTVGKNSLEAMPASLPANSAYTYAVELGVEGAYGTDVRFTDSTGAEKPVLYYTDNFLNFPIGTVVPAGYFDTVKAEWVAGESGRVISVIGNDGTGKARLDVDSAAGEDTGAALTSLGITDEERAQLWTTYGAGALPKHIWRNRLSHFSIWDFNWPGSPPEDAVWPKEDDPTAIKADCEGERPETTKPGSDIGCLNQSLKESVRITGTPYNLVYKSSQQLGSDRRIRIPVVTTPAEVPASVKRIDVSVQVEGMVYTNQYAWPGAPRYQDFRWNGLDGRGNRVNGSSTALIQLSYVYDTIYGSTGRFGENGQGITFPTAGSRAQIGLPQTWLVPLRHWDRVGQGLGGWSIDVQHAFDIVGNRIVLGDGRTQQVGGAVAALNTIAGTGEGNNGPDNVPAIQSALNLSGFCAGNTLCSHQVVVAPDGSVLFTDSGSGRVRAISPDGIISTAASIPAPSGLAYGDGGVFVSSIGGVVWFVKDGTQTVIAGDVNGGSGSSGDGGPAVDATLSRPEQIAYRDGVLYIADSQALRVRKVAGGVITTVAGGGPVVAIEGAVATQSQVLAADAVAVGPDGTVYFGGWPTNGTPTIIWAVGTDGLLKKLAGSGQATPNFGDGGLAVDANLSAPDSLAVTEDGSVYIADGGHHCVRRINRLGVIETVAGICGQFGPGTEGTPPTATHLRRPRGIGLGPDGTLYIADTLNNRIRKAAPARPIPINDKWILPSSDGRQVYHFFLNGRHDKTTDARTGVLIHQFNYDGDRRVLSIVDAFNRSTSIAYTDPITITGPHGQASTLKLGTDGYLKEFTNPASGLWTFTYTTDGLMKTMKDAKANAALSGLAYRFDYTEGRLISDTDAADKLQTLTYSARDKGWHTTHTSATGKLTEHEVTRFSRFHDKQETTFPSLLSDVFEQRSDLTPYFASPDDPSAMIYTGYQKRPDGSAVYGTLSSDYRFFDKAPFVSRTKILTRGDGSGLELLETRSRTGTVDSSGIALSSETETRTTNSVSATRVFARNGGGTGIHRFTTTSPGGRVSTMDVNDRGQPLVFTPPGGLAPSYFSYDTAGRLTYFATGLGVDCSNPAGSSTDCRRSIASYIASGSLKGYLQSVTDAFPRTTQFTPDLLGRPLKEQYISAVGSPFVSITWDPNGNLESVTPPSRPAHSMTNTPVNLLDTYTPPAAGLPSYATSYVWNGDRTLSTETKPGGTTVTTTPDAAGRLDVVTFPGGSIDVDYIAAGSGAGRVGALHGPYGTDVAFQYEGFLPTRTTWSGNATGEVSWTYDNNFRRVSETVTGASGTGTMYYAYDNDGTRTCASKTSCSPTPAADALTVVVDTRGLVKTITLGNVVETNSYNDYGEIQSQSVKHGSTAIFSATYDSASVRRDKLGRVVRKVENVSGVTQTYDYTYNDRNRLWEVRRGGTLVEAFTYDANGNRLTGPQNRATVPGADSQDRLPNYGEFTYTYGANGELWKKTVSGQDTTYSYDALGNLKSVQLPGVALIEYLADGAGRRVGKKVGGSVVRRWIYGDSLSPAAELDGNGNLVSQFAYSSKRNVPDVMIRGGNIYRIITDQLGSVRMVQNVNNPSDRPFQADYSAFGEVTFATGTAPDWLPFGFAGGLNDIDTKLVRFGARDYDPLTGRWVSKDPILFGGGQSNLYVYVENDPVNAIDPTGRMIMMQRDPFLAWMQEQADAWFEVAGSNYTNGNVLASIGPAAMGAFVEFFPWALQIGLQAAPFCGTVGMNPRGGGGRINTDLPGGRSAAKSLFRNMSEGPVEQAPLGNGGIRRWDSSGVQIRMNRDGTTRVDLPGTPPETIHYGP
jgi:RHS repeat-associated protein